MPILNHSKTQIKKFSWSNGSFSNMRVSLKYRQKKRSGSNKKESDKSERQEVKIYLRVRIKRIQNGTAVTVVMAVSSTFQIARIRQKPQECEILAIRKSWISFSIFLPSSSNQAYQILALPMCLTLYKKKKQCFKMPNSVRCLLSAKISQDLRQSHKKTLWRCLNGSTRKWMLWRRTTGKDGSGAVMKMEVKTRYENLVKVLKFKPLRNQVIT